MGNAHGHADHHRKPSGGQGGHDGFTFGNEKIQGLASNRETSPYDPSGPVDVLSPSVVSPSRIAPTAKAHRPRATTESGPRRHISIEYSTSHDIEDTNGLNVANVDVDSNEKKMPTIIKYSGQGREVFVCGTFNNWQKLKMSRSQKDFVAMVELGEGDHEYKFLVDGQWVTDSNAPSVENNAGFKNNVIHVQKEDFDAFEALDMDMATVSKAQDLKKKISMKPQTQYGQEMPIMPTGGAPNSSESYHPKSSTPYFTTTFTSSYLKQGYTNVM